MKHVIKSMTAAAAMSLISGGTSASAADLLRCKAISAVRLNDEGALERSGYGDIWIIDMASGVVRIGDGTHQDKSKPPAQIGPLQWHVTIPVSNNNDGVVVESRSSPTRHFIRIRKWRGMDKILFQRFYLSQLITGTCTPLY